jgi:hypothetical protein
MQFLDPSTGDDFAGRTAWIRQLAKEQVTPLTFPQWEVQLEMVRKEPRQN